RLINGGYAVKGEIEILIKLCEALLTQAAPITVFDLGANVGTHSLALAKTFDGRITVHAVEAQRQIFHMLCGTMALNGLDNVRCYRAAVSDRAGKTLTYDCPTTDRRITSAGWSLCRR
ncbi:MAG: FkbM family methyltransferase, partial [Pseudomonadota bacterium]|nr:FkbM family methyltransferase [Pseudomonadota bacterium]